MTTQQDTLFLKLNDDGRYWPGDHISQALALEHFSGGSCAISRDRLDEIIYVAGLHGWKVATEGNEKV